jgi:hypothetical protein
MKLCTLIPAFKVQYLPDLLACLERQTVKPDAVLLSDDSPQADFVQALAGMPERCSALGLAAVRGPRQGAWANVRHLARWWGGRSALVHLYLDDDLIAPEFYERHLALHASRRFAATVSLRWTADERGLPLERSRPPESVRQHAQRVLTLDGAFAFASTVGEGVNWLGEFSNAVLEGDMLGFVVRPVLAGVPVIGLEDLGTFLAAATRTPLGLINEHLGCFRTSPGQNTAQLQGLVMKLSTCAWLPLALAGERLELLSPAQRRRCAQVIGPMLIGRYGADPELAPFAAAAAALMHGGASAPARLLEAWQALVAAKVPQVLTPEQPTLETA